MEQSCQFLKYWYCWSVYLLVSFLWHCCWVWWFFHLYYQLLFTGRRNIVNLRKLYPEIFHKTVMGTTTVSLFTNFVHSDSRLDFLTGSIFPAKINLLVCFHSVFGLSSVNILCFFYQESLSIEMLGILNTPFFLWLE